MNPSVTGAAENRTLYLGLPAYNEELAIAPLFSRIRLARQALVNKNLVSDLRVLVYDDGSTDRTALEVKQNSRELNVQLLIPKENGGLGVALRGLFTQFMEEASPGDLLVIMDTDDTHDPAQIEELLLLLDQGGLDVVIASRYRKGSRTSGVPTYRQALSIGFAGLVRLVLPIRGVLDYSCGYRMYTHTALTRIYTDGGFPLQESGFAAMPEVLIRLRGQSLRFGEIPLRLAYDRRLTASKMQAWKNSKRLLSRIWSWRLHPEGLSQKPFAGSAGKSWWSTETLEEQ
jgi:dolichol-phosphate mannosyltransferase